MNLSFGEALSEMERGKKIARQGWNGKGMHVSLCTPEISKTRPEILPYMELEDNDGNLIPWTPSQTDALSKDWFICV